MKLKEIFAPGPRTSLLEFFLSHPDGCFSLTEVARKTKISLGAAFLHCSDLWKKTFLFREKKGKSTYYRLNRESRTVKYLKRFYNLISDPLEKFIEEIKKHNIKKIILFGSYARGEDTKGSDMDLLIIGDLKKDQALLIAQRLAFSGQLRFSPLVKTWEEYLSLKEKEKLLWERINSEGVVVYET